MSAVEDYIHYQTQASLIFKDAHQGRIDSLNRIEELESELQVWKSGYAEKRVALERAEKELKFMNEGDPLIAVVVDGDGCLFDRKFIERGREGGREAALALAKQVNDLSDRLLGRAAQIIVSVFLNSAGLSFVMSNLGISPEVFAAFSSGFTASHPLFTIVDVGIQKEAADAKIRAMVSLFTNLPSCKLVLAGIGHDGGYSSLVQGIETEGSIEKVYVLKGYSDMAFELERLNLKTVEFLGIFEPKKLVISHANGATKKAYTSGYSSGREGGNAVFGTLTPKSFKQVLATSPSKPTSYLSKKLVAASIGGFSHSSSNPVPGSPMTSGNKSGAVSNNGTSISIDKKVSFTKVGEGKKYIPKQGVRPCNVFYLETTCPKKDDCKYCHDYVLTDKQLSALRVDARKSPCSRMMYGKTCNKPKCSAGHVCPFGTKCKFGKTCRFDQPDMHAAAGWSDEDQSDNSVEESGSD